MGKIPGDMLVPFSVGYIKGWRRSISALIAAEGIKALNIDFAEVTNEFKAGLTCTFIGSVSVSESLTQPSLDLELSVTRDYNM